MRHQRAELEATFEETRRQIEEDVDREVHELRTKYEARLTHERNEALRLKGENGIMNKKFASLQKEIEEQKEEIQALFANKKDLYAQIASLEKARRERTARQRRTAAPAHGLLSRVLEALPRASRSVPSLISSSPLPRLSRLPLNLRARAGHFGVEA